MNKLQLTRNGIESCNLFDANISMFVWDGSREQADSLLKLTHGAFQVLPCQGSLILRFQSLRYNGHIGEGGWLLILNGDIVCHGQGKTLEN